MPPHGGWERDASKHVQVCEKHQTFRSATSRGTQGNVNFLFKRQWKRLAGRDRKKKSDGNDDESSSGGDTDDGLNALCSDTEDSDDRAGENQSDSDSDSLAAELEAELAMKARGPTEEEDAAELDQLRNELGGGIGTEDPKKLLERELSQKEEITFETNYHAYVSRWSTSDGRGRHHRHCRRSLDASQSAREEGF